MLPLLRPLSHPYCILCPSFQVERHGLSTEVCLQLLLQYNISHDYELLAFQLIKNEENQGLNLYCRDIDPQNAIVQDRLRYASRLLKKVCRNAWATSGSYQESVQLLEDFDIRQLSFEVLLAIQPFDDMHSSLIDILQIRRVQTIVSFDL